MYRKIDMTRKQVHIPTGVFTRQLLGSRDLARRADL